MPELEGHTKKIVLYLRSMTKLFVLAESAERPEGVHRAPIWNASGDLPESNHQNQSGRAGKPYRSTEEGREAEKPEAGLQDLEEHQQTASRGALYWLVGSYIANSREEATESPTEGAQNATASNSGVLRPKNRGTRKNRPSVMAQNPFSEGKPIVNLSGKQEPV